jgi:two-component system, sensor histidine kinase
MSSQPVLLYVEDDPLSRQVMQMLIERGLGFEHLTIFDDSNNFLPRLEALSPQPDIIFLDIHMKPYNGFEVLEMIRNHEVFYNIPVVAVTASVMSEEIDSLKDAGFDAGISKPVDQGFFSEFIYRVLQGESVWHVI